MSMSVFEMENMVTERHLVWMGPMCRVNTVCVSVCVCVSDPPLVDHWPCDATVGSSETFPAPPQAQVGVASINRNQSFLRVLIISKWKLDSCLFAATLLNLYWSLC